MPEPRTAEELDNRCKDNFFRFGKEVEPNYNEENLDPDDDVIDDPLEGFHVEKERYFVPIDEV